MLNPELDHSPAALIAHLEQTITAIMFDTMPRQDTVYDLLDLIALRAVGEAAVQSIHEQGANGEKALKVIELVVPHVVRRLLNLCAGKPDETPAEREAFRVALERIYKDSKEDN